MLFSSITFLYYFLPNTLLIYALMPQRFKNSVLLVASLLFYAWGEPKYIVLMLLSILIGYGFGLWIEQCRHKPYAKYVLMASILICSSFLVFFKYTDFLITNLNSLGFQFNVLKVGLPIGISFYTFQIISYLIDVYRKDVKAQKNVFYLATYIAMFPQLIAGPIVRYSDIEKELSERTYSLSQCASGIRRFTIGLAKKVLIANVLAELCSIFRTTSDPSVLYYWMYAIGFTFHIYFDFSGYSDMAIGLGEIFGFHFPENFRYPYLSSSITEFWRRWHISLGTWFRDYVYIPLGGNHVSKKRWLVNLMIVWALTGLWHGAAWNFVLWGIGFGLILIVEKLWLFQYLQRWRFINHIYVMLIVIISFVLFNAVDLQQAFLDISHLFGFGGVPLVSAEAVYYLKSYFVTFILATVACTPLLKQAYTYLLQRPKSEALMNLVEPFLLVGLMLVISAYLVDGSFNPFIYFRF